MQPKQYEHINDNELLERFYVDKNSEWIGILLQRYTLLLLGTCMKYLKNQEEAKDFIRVKCLYDNYEGWCQKSQLTELTDDLPATSIFINQAIGEVIVNDKPCRVSLATPWFDKPISAKHFTIQYPSQKTVDTATIVFNEENIKAISFQFLNTPYLWGGKSVLGIDCSGFTQQVFKMVNIFLRRDAYQQAEQGESIGFLQEVKCGDLAFFDNDEGRITHVGILLNSETIIHSAGRVRVDNIDNAGIINVETGERTHKLRIIKRYK